MGRIKRGDGEDGEPVGAHHAGPDARQVSRWSARVSRYRGTRRQLLAEMPHHNEPRTSLKRHNVKRYLIQWFFNLLVKMLQQINALDNEH